MPFFVRSKHKFGPEATGLFISILPHDTSHMQAAAYHMTLDTPFSFFVMDTLHLTDSSELPTLGSALNRHGLGRFVR